jgi:hypothetical protein
MKTFAAFAIALCVLCGVGPFARPAHATPVTITLNDQEVQALLALLDLAAKEGGIRAAAAVNHFAQKVQPKSAAPVEVKPEEKKSDLPTTPEKK